MVDEGVTQSSVCIGRTTQPRGGLLTVIGEHENQRLCGNFVRLTCLVVGPSGAGSHRCSKCL